MGIETGIIKGDLVIHHGHVKVVEIAARLSGGFFGTVATPTSCGVDLVRTNISLCLGEGIDPETLQHRFERAAAIRFAFPEPGRVRRVSGQDRVLRDPATRYAHVFVGEGDIIPPMTNHPARPAVVVADGSCLSEAIHNAERLIRLLQWEVEDV
jgi:biotin carboxylase